jgi:cysteine desulfurase
MKVPTELARGAVRISFGASNTPAQVEDFLQTLTGTIAALRGLVAMAE